METYLAILRRHVWLILLVVVATAGGAYIASARQAAAYQATSELLVNRIPTVQLPDAAPTPATDALSLNRQLSTESQLAAIPQVARAALVQAGVHTMTAQQLLDKVSVVSKPNADLITFTVTAPSAALAERLSAAYAQQFSSYQQQIETNLLNQQARQIAAALSKTPLGPVHTRLSAALGAVSAAVGYAQPSSTVVSTATDATQTAPKPARNTLLALAIGLLLGGALAFLFDALDKRAHGTMEISDLLGLNALARVPAPTKRRSRKGVQPGVAMLTDPGSPQAEAIKMLQANLELACLNGDRRLTTVMFTSALRQEGKSTTVANVAVSLAQAGRNVVVVDADLRRPSLARLLGTDDEPGLSELALGTTSLEHLDDLLIDVPLGAGEVPTPVRGRLRVLPSGHRQGQPDRLLSSPALGAVFSALSHSAEIVLVDTPPMTEVYDALVVSHYVDAVIAVARVSYVKTPALAEFGRLLGTASAHPMGYVATGVRWRDVGRYYAPPQKAATTQEQEAAAGSARARL